MSKWKVIRVIDGDTIQVTPEWIWGDKSGNTVRILGYNPNKYGMQHNFFLRSRLEKILLFKEVELVKPVRIIHSELICEVHIKGVDVSNFLLEFA